MTSSKRRSKSLGVWGGDSADPEPLPDSKPTSKTRAEQPGSSSSNTDNFTNLSQKNRSREEVLPVNIPAGYKRATKWAWMNKMPWGWINAQGRQEVRREYDLRRQQDKRQSKRKLFESLALSKAEDWWAKEQRRGKRRDAVTEQEKRQKDKMIKTIAKALVDEVDGMGARLQPLIDSRDYTDIIVQGCRNTVLHPRKGGPRMIGPRVWDTEQEMVEAISQLASEQNVSFSPAQPGFDGETPQGDRVHAICALAAEPRLTIRCHDMELATLEDLRKKNTIEDTLLKFFKAAVKTKLNIIVSGATGTGKTTLLRALINEIGPEENIFTIEDSPELGIFEEFGDKHPCGTAMLARKPNQEGAGEFTLDYLVKQTLRMNPDRVIVGEVRGEEALSMAMAMSQGNDGSMCSVHSNNAVDTLDRLGVYITQHQDAPADQKTDILIAKAINVIVHVQRRGNSRFISEVVEVQDYRDGNITRGYLFASGSDGRAKVTRDCTFSPYLSDKLAPHGFTRNDYQQNTNWEA